MTLPLVPLARGLDAVADAAAGARVVLLGEATHGTHEFYALRAEITRRLIAEHGFAAVAGAFLVGFTTYEGTVTAASDWDAPAERKRVRPALAESWDELFRREGEPAFSLLTSEPAEELRDALLERAIGVVYRPETERALAPLERTAGWERGELPETYPSAL